MGNLLRQDAHGLESDAGEPPRAQSDRLGGAEHRLDNKIARVLRGRKSGKTGGTSGAERENTR
jgi:hypothetical protein